VLFVKRPPASSKPLVIRPTVLVDTPSTTYLPPCVQAVCADISPRETYFKSSEPYTYTDRTKYQSSSLKTYTMATTTAPAASVIPSLAERPVKNTICLFDVDGTLTPARRVSALQPTTKP
jgi:hypothetical protein